MDIYKPASDPETIAQGLAEGWIVPTQDDHLTTCQTCTHWGGTNPRRAYCWHHGTTTHPEHTCEKWSKAYVVKSEGHTVPAPFA